MKLFGYKLTLTAKIGLIIIALNLIMAVFAPLIAPYSPLDPDNDAGAYADPSWTHLLGTDQIGRDLLSRIIYGARLSIGISIAATCLSFFVGITAGFTAAVSNRWIDMGMSRFVDLLLSIPTLIAAFIVISALGTSMPVLIITIAILDSTKVFRLARAVAMNITVMEFVESARLRGEGLWWIIRREILPNAVPPLVAEFGLRFCFTFLTVAALSFLGLGIQPPQADWGGLVKDLKDVITLGGWAPLYPAAAIAILSIGVNFVVDWMLAIHSKGHGEGV